MSRNTGYNGAAKRPESRGARVEIRSLHGSTAFILDGTPTPAALVNCGVREPSVVNPHHLYRLAGCDPGWTGPQQVDPSETIHRIEALVAHDPSARVLLQVPVDAPEWWRAAHPGECVGYCLPFTGVPPASWASERWIADAAAMLDRFIRNLREAGPEDRILGLELASGAHGEWRAENAELLPDAGPRMTERFRAAMVDKYRRNEGLLRRGWMEARAGFRDMRCPTAEDRRRTDFGVFRGARQSRRLLDYYETLFTAQAEAAIALCRAAHRALEHAGVVGLSFATLFHPDTVAEDGHAYPDRVLESPHVDFIINHGPAGGGYLRAPADSLRLHGKPLIHIAHDHSDPVAESALAATNGAGIALPGKLPSDALETVSALFAERIRSGPARESVAQVAMIVDPAAAQYTTSPDSASGWLNGVMTTGQRAELLALGAPVAVHLLSDLFHPKFPDYKVTLFANCFYLSAAERRQVDARCKRSEKTVVWPWAAGIISETTLNADAAQQLCGIKLRAEREITSLRLRTVDAADALIRGLHIGSRLGIERAVAPSITVPDRRCKRIAGNSDNKTAFARLEQPTWTSIYFGSVPVPALVMRNAVRAAGCHLYADGMAVHADSRLVSVPRNAGQVSLPGAYDVRDCRTGRVVAQGVSEIEVPADESGPALYSIRKRG